MTFFPVFGRQKNDIQTYDFFPSFRTAKKTTYKPMTFFPVFGRQKKRHTNLWLFSQFSNNIKTTMTNQFSNDITYDFFTTFFNLWLQFSNLTNLDFFTSFQTTSPMTFLPVFKRHKMTFLPVFGRHTNLWLFYQFSAKKTTYKPMTFLPVFKRHTNLWLFQVFKRHTNLWLFRQAVLGLVGAVGSASVS